MPKRRRHSLEFKRQVVAAASQPGASLAAVALEHQINTNLLHTWRRQLAQMDASEGTAAASTLLPVTVLPDKVAAIPVALSDSNLTSHAEGTIEIKFPRVTVSVHGSNKVDS
jgi:transposase